MYRKLIIKESWARNMFSSSNMDFCMADVTLGVIVYKKVQDEVLLGQKKICG